MRLDPLQFAQNAHAVFDRQFRARHIVPAFERHFHNVLLEIGLGRHELHAPEQLNVEEPARNKRFAENLLSKIASEKFCAALRIADRQLDKALDDHAHDLSNRLPDHAPFELRASLPLTRTDHGIRLRIVFKAGNKARHLVERCREIRIPEADVVRCFAIRCEHVENPSPHRSGLAAVLRVGDDLDATGKALRHRVQPLQCGIRAAVVDKAEPHRRMGLGKSQIRVNVQPPCLVEAGKNHGYWKVGTHLISPIANILVK